MDDSKSQLQYVPQLPPPPANDEVVMARSALADAGYRYYWHPLSQCPAFQKLLWKEKGQDSSGGTRLDETWLDVLEYDFRYIPGYDGRFTEPIRYEFQIRIESNLNVDLNVFQLSPLLLIEKLEGMENKIRSLGQVIQSMVW